MQARLLSEDMRPTFVSDFFPFSPWKRKHEEDNARGKERKVGAPAGKFESFAGKLRKSLGGLGGWTVRGKGEWARSLAGKEYTGGHLRPHITPIP